jgi:hypothetical protein
LTFAEFMKFLDQLVSGPGVKDRGFNVDVVGLGLVEAPEFSPALLDPQAVGDLAEVSGLNGPVGDLPEGVEAGRLDDALLFDAFDRPALQGRVVALLGGLAARVADLDGDLVERVPGDS